MVVPFFGPSHFRYSSWSFPIATSGARAVQRRTFGVVPFRRQASPAKRARDEAQAGGVDLLQDQRQGTGPGQQADPVRARPELRGALPIAVQVRVRFGCC